MRKIILENQKTFEGLVRAIVNTPSLTKKVGLAKKAIAFANSSSCGHFSSPEIENVFLTLANKKSVLEPRQGFQGNTFLHVMTKCYAVGGHTRAVERWIDFADSSEKHSVLFTGWPLRTVPLKLKTVVAQKNGQIHWLPCWQTDFQKALRLRKQAAHFDVIILHVHMHDVIPLIAFGAEEFTRPVIFYNHADHRFWVGGSVAHQVAELRSWGKEISQNRRGLFNNFVVGIPNEGPTVRTSNKIDLRKKLELPLDKKVIITVGSANKYQPFGRFDFLKTVKKFFEQREDVLLIAIGPDERFCHEWQKATQATQGRILALGLKTPDVLNDYIGAADLALDSFPMSGGTALADIVSAGVPVLALDCPTGQMDYISDSEVSCKTEEELLKKMHVLLDNPEEAQKQRQLLLQKLFSAQGAATWNVKTQNLYAEARKSKCRPQLLRSCPVEVDELDEFLLYNNANPRRVFCLFKRFIVSIYYFNQKFTVKVSFGGKSFWLGSNLDILKTLAKN